MIRNLWTTICFLWNHPLSRGQRIHVLGEWLRWHVASRVMNCAFVVPWLGQTRLIVRRGMTGATGNIYVGLMEFPEMAFVLHFLRMDDLFIDIGANVGVYSILASGISGCRTIAVEPVPSTFSHLSDNIKINSLESLVDCKCLALGAETGKVTFTSGLDTLNHVAIPEKDEQNDNMCIKVPLCRLDDLLGRGEGENSPVCIKLDVEGYECPVIQGGGHVFSNPSLLAVIMELNGSGLRYGFCDSDLHNTMLRFGFRPIDYDPFSRRILPRTAPHDNGNTIYIRNVRQVEMRLRGGRKINIKNIDI